MVTTRRLKKVGATANTKGTTTPATPSRRSTRGRVPNRIYESIGEGNCPSSKRKKLKQPINSNNNNTKRRKKALSTTPEDGIDILSPSKNRCNSTGGKNLSKRTSSTPTNKITKDLSSEENNDDGDSKMEVDNNDETKKNDEDKDDKQAAADAQAIAQAEAQAEAQAKTKAQAQADAQAMILFVAIANAQA